MAAGLISWVLLEVLQPDTYWPPQLIGLLMSAAGMAIGSLAPHVVGRPTPLAPAHAYLHGHAAHAHEEAHHPHRVAPPND
jgi:hypothetical protein